MMLIILLRKNKLMEEEKVEIIEDGELEGEEVTDQDREEIARLVRDGNTSGQFSSGVCTVSWELSINKF